MFRRPVPLPIPALALSLALALLCPAPLAAADMLQEPLKGKAQTEQEQQKTSSQDLQLHHGQSAEGGQQQAAPKSGKAFPGPVQQPGTQISGQAGTRPGGQASTPQPAGNAAPKSGKAMYGDIVIHK